jgi:predicted transglutaminase-like cysteine proteinase
MSDENSRQKSGSAQLKTVCVLATLIFACVLPYAKGRSYPYDFQNGAHAGILESAAPPIASPGGVVEGPTFNAAAGSSINYLLFPYDLTAAIQSNSFNISPPVTTISSLKRETDSRAIQSTAQRETFYRPLTETEPARINFGTATLAPMAFIRFCIKYPRDCETRHMAFRPHPVALNAARKAELDAVNRDVNRAIRPRANDGGVMQEEWLVSPREGDCNDYAVTKRHQLLARGWPSRSLLLSEVAISSGEHHLVLIVQTRDGDFLLDNLNATVLPVSQVAYQWIRAQQQKNPRFWSAINVTRVARVAMSTR